MPAEARRGRQIPELELQAVVSSQHMDLGPLKELPLLTLHQLFQCSLAQTFPPFLPSLPPFFFFKIGSHHEAQANLEFTDPPASASRQPGLKVCGIMSGRHALPCVKKCIWKGSRKRHLPLTTGAGPLLTSDSSTCCCRDTAQWETCQLASAMPMPWLGPHTTHKNNTPAAPRVTNASLSWDRGPLFCQHVSL